ncbi:MAG: hypothetical protein EOO38_00330 [Cytophagaceae bacterium]|nr:MAG: hypothetical protein EOO38_00330 [Cytophagaceae bacterium]
MKLGETPAEGWPVYLRQEEARLLRERYVCDAPVVPSQWHDDIDAYVESLLTEPADPLPMTQVQLDWDRFVTFGEQLDALEQPRSLTPSPIMTSHAPPAGYPMTRETSFDRPPAQVVTIRSRAAARDVTRRRLQTEPLHNTHQGRSILQLSERVWYRTASDFFVTQYPLDSNVWLPNDEANYLHWLDRGIMVHRSTSHGLLCVEDIDALNAVLAEAGVRPIIPLATPPDWQARWHRGSDARRNLPSFLRAGYSRRAVLHHMIDRPAYRARPPRRRLQYGPSRQEQGSRATHASQPEAAGQAASASQRPSSETTQASSP